MYCVGGQARIGRVAVLFGVVGLSIVTASQALAGAFGLREQSAYSQGASFAGEATCGESIAGAFYNPAVISCADGLEIEGSLTGILPIIDVTTSPFPGSLFGPGSPLFNAGSPGDIGVAALVPALTAAYKFDENWSFGVTVNGPFGLSTKTALNHAAQIYGRDTEVFSLNVNPIVSYRFNDVFAIAAGLGIQYFDVRLTQAISPVPFAGTAEIKGDDIGFGGTVGVLITPTPNTEIGIGYRSPVKQNVDGSLAIPFVGQFPITVEPTLPEVVSASIRHRFTDQFTLMGTVEWTNWSRIGTFPVINNYTGLPATYLPFEYQDGWYLSVGGEYEWSDKWTLRAGVGWERSPIDTGNRNVRLPDGNRLFLSVGASYDWTERLKLNVAYSYLQAFDTDIAIVPGNPVYIAPVTFMADSDVSAHFLSVGLKYRFGGAPAAAEEMVYKN